MEGSHPGLAAKAKFAIVDGRIVCFPEVDQGRRMILAPGELDCPVDETNHCAGISRFKFTLLLPRHDKVSMITWHW